MMDEVLTSVWLSRGAQLRTHDCAGASEATAPPASEATAPPASEATAPPASEATAPPASEATASPASEATAPPAVAYLLFEQRAKSGSSLVLIPGLGEGIATWTRLLPRIEHQGRCFVLDHPHYPETGVRPRSPVVSVSAYVHAVRDLVKTLPSPTHLIGSSLGGIVALRVAASEPQRVASVCALGLHPSVAQLQYLLPLFDVRDLSQLDRLLRQCWHQPPALRECDARALLDKLTSSALRALLADLAKLDVQSEIVRAAAASIPVFFMTGSRDGLMAAGRAAARAGEPGVRGALVPAARVCELENCGHYPHIEQAGPCAQWLERCWSSAVSED